jgi:hypothetical protein
MMQTAKQHNASQGIGESEFMPNFTPSFTAQYVIDTIKETCKNIVPLVKSEESRPSIGSPNNPFDVI